MADNTPSGKNTMVWVGDTLQPWTANHQVEVTQTMTSANQRYRADRGKWPLRYEVTNRGTW